MKINIEYDGSTAVCTVNGRYFKECDRFEQVFALDAFRTIQEDYKREVRAGRIKDLSPEDMFVI